MVIENLMKEKKIGICIDFKVSITKYVVSKKLIKERELM